MSCRSGGDIWSDMIPKSFFPLSLWHPFCKLRTRYSLAGISQSVGDTWYIKSCMDRDLCCTLPTCHCHLFNKWTVQGWPQNPNKTINNHSFNLLYFTSYWLYSRRLLVNHPLSEILTKACTYKRCAIRLHHQVTEQLLPFKFKKTTTKNTSSTFLRVLNSPGNISG